MNYRWVDLRGGSAVVQPVAAPVDVSAVVPAAVAVVG